MRPRETMQRRLMARVCGGQSCGVSSGRRAGNLALVGGALYMHGAGPGSGSAAGFGSGSVRLRRRASGVLCGHARDALAASELLLLLFFCELSPRHAGARAC